MTDKDKLKKLLQLAASNGYKLNHYVSEYWIKRNYDKQFTIEDLTLCCDLSDEPLNLEFTLSINDIVLDFDGTSTNFTLALFLANCSAAWDKLLSGKTNIYIEGMNCNESVILNWTTQKQFDGDKYVCSTRLSDDRLNWLFDFFSHLLN